MASPAKINFKMYQGATFNEVLRWESNTTIYKYITGITNTAPVVISSSGHGMPAGWRFKVTNVGGMKDINSSETYRIASNVDANNITIGDLNGIGFSTYTSGGVIEYNQPYSLSGVTARMQLREKISSTSFIAEYTTENGNILIDNVNKVVTINVDAATTAGYTFSTAVYALEIVSGSTVTPLVTGTITLVKEITK